MDTEAPSGRHVLVEGDRSATEVVEFVIAIVADRRTHTDP